jgi:hypothetical protein
MLLLVPCTSSTSTSTSHLYQHKYYVLLLCFIPVVAMDRSTITVYSDESVIKKASQWFSKFRMMMFYYWYVVLCTCSSKMPTSFKIAMRTSYMYLFSSPTVSFVCRKVRNGDISVSSAYYLEFRNWNWKSNVEGVCTSTCTCMSIAKNCIPLSIK